MTQPTKKIALVGVGGLGTPAAMGIVRNWHGKSPLHLALIDPDRIELSNLNRQVLFGESDVGREKSKVLAERLEQRYSARSKSVFFSTHVTKLDAENVDDLLGESDFVIDATDSAAAKLLINDWCVREGKPFVHAGVVGEEGQALAVRPGGACVRCLFGEFGAKDIEEREVSCATAGILGPVAGVLGFFCGGVALESLLPAAAEETGSQLFRFGTGRSRLERQEVLPSSACSLGCAKTARVALDLRRKKCPETFLFSKLAFEQLKDNVVLELSFESYETANNVAQTFSTQKIAFPRSPGLGEDGSWKLFVKKAEG